MKTIFIFACIQYVLIIFVVAPLLLAHLTSAAEPALYWVMWWAVVTAIFVAWGTFLMWATGAMDKS